MSSESLGENETRADMAVAGLSERVVRVRPPEKVTLELRTAG